MKKLCYIDLLSVRGALGWFYFESLLQVNYVYCFIYFIFFFFLLFSFFISLILFFSFADHTAPSAFQVRLGYTQPTTSTSLLAWTMLIQAGKVYMTKPKSRLAQAKEKSLDWVPTIDSFFTPCHACFLRVVVSPSPGPLN